MIRIFNFLLCVVLLTHLSTLSNHQITLTKNQTSHNVSLIDYDGELNSIGMPSDIFLSYRHTAPDTSRPKIPLKKSSQKKQFSITESNQFAAQPTCSWISQRIYFLGNKILEMPAHAQFQNVHAHELRQRHEQWVCSKCNEQNISLTLGSCPA